MTIINSMTCIRSMSLFLLSLFLFLFLTQIYAMPDLNCCIQGEPAQLSIQSYILTYGHVVIAV
jgi:hypothetical protein